MVLIKNVVCACRTARLRALCVRILTACGWTGIRPITVHLYRRPLAVSPVVQNVSRGHSSVMTNAVNSVTCMCAAACHGRVNSNFDKMYVEKIYIHNTDMTFIYTFNLSTYRYSLRIWKQKSVNKEKIVRLNFIKIWRFLHSFRFEPFARLRIQGL